MFSRRIIGYLKDWKDRPDRKPLILRGARQVGKTVSVQMFAEKYFQEFIYLNLDDPQQEKLFRGELSLDDFEKMIQVKFNKDLKPGRTLLFIDEIQNSPSLIKLLRFFYEKKPDLHVIAAGSLLEAKLKKDGLAFPVGRVEYAYLYPLDFFEYLEAKEERGLLDSLRQATLDRPLPQALSELANRFFNEYLIVGGMPEAVKVYLTSKSLVSVGRVHHSLLTAYAEDIPKYSSEAKVRYLLHCLEQAPVFAGQNVTYEHFGGSAYRSREMSQALEALGKAMLIYQVMGSKEVALPLLAKRKKAAKLLFLDVGLVNYRLGLRDKLFEVTELDDFFRGRIAEQITGQHLLNQAPDRINQVFYWYRDVPGSVAEVDFIFAGRGGIIALEVKSGKTGRLRSLKEFVKATGVKTVFRISSRPLIREDVRINGTDFTLISLPFYLLPRLQDFI